MLEKQAIGGDVRKCVLKTIGCIVVIGLGLVSCTSLQSSKLPDSMDDDDEHEVPLGVITAINFDVLTKADMEKIAALEINAPGQVTSSDLGFPNQSSECSTCGSKDGTSCEGHFGFIKFAFGILHPYFLSEIAEILNRTCPGCKSIRRNRRDLCNKGEKPTSRIQRPNGCKYCAWNSMGWYPTVKFKVSSSSNDVFRKNSIIVEINDKVQKKKGTSGRVLPSDYWDFIPRDAQQDESHMKLNRRVLSPLQVYSLLSEIDSNFIEKFVRRMEFLGFDGILVTPNCHRMSEVMHTHSNQNRLHYDERTRTFKKLVDFRGTANELSSRVLDCLRMSKLNPDKTPSRSCAGIQKRMNPENAGNISGLKWMKDVVLGKRNDHTFRAVVVGDPDLELQEIGVPCQIAERLQVPEHVNKQNKERLSYYCELLLLGKRHIKVCRKGYPVLLHNREELKTGDMLYRPLDDGDIVLINRPPSIHQHSLIALSVRVLPTSSVVSINPLCCSPLCGDFDGDCLHGYIPQSVAASVELNELVALDKQLINGQSGRNLLSLSQDSLTAAYLLMEGGVLLNDFQIQQLQMLSPYNLTPLAIEKGASTKMSLWSGSQLFSMLLPSGFVSSEACGMSHDCDFNTVQSLLHRIHGKTLELLYGVQRALCEWLSLTGFSVSLSDLYLSSDSHGRKNMMEEISHALKDAEQACYFKLLLVDYYRDFLLESCQGYENDMVVEVEHLNNERQVSAALSQASVDAFRQVFRDIQSLTYVYACKDNSLLCMFKAGSKGNLLRLVQHTMCLGLQHSLVRLSFKIPHQLSCAGWNSRMCDSYQTVCPESVQTYIPYAVIKSSFLTGLNPLECFVHSVSNRDSSFSGNADLPGTLTRKLMFFMRDLYSAYDGTVRNLYGNQLVQFSHDIDKDSSLNTRFQEYTTGGEPVGALSACAISEAAYSALDQPISLLEQSPLLNLKNVIECGSKKLGDEIMSLFFSKKLSERRYGCEYAALDVKNYLEKLLFSDIVSTVMITFDLRSSSQAQYSPWVCHFHFDKEIARRRRLKSQSIINSLYQRCDYLRKQRKVSLPSLKISCKKCSAAYMAKEGEDCITVAVVENSKNTIQLGDVRDLLIPFLLGAAIKGFMEIKKVDILWNSQRKVSKSNNGSSGELYLRVTMSGDSGSGRLWGVLLNHCLQIMDMIDWTRSHPDSIHHSCSVYGIDAGRKYFLNRLASAISDTGKAVLPKHLLLVANSLSVSGEFVGLNAKGMALQRKHTDVSSPFLQACFSEPGRCFLKAAKSGDVDHLEGSLDALAWGKSPSMGSSGQFDIIFSDKEQEVAMPVDVYNLLEASSEGLKEENVNAPATQNYLSDKCGFKLRYKNGGYALKWRKKLASLLRSSITPNDIRKLLFASTSMLKKYSVDQLLGERDKSTMLMLLHFHPHKKEKIGCGTQDIKVGWHPLYKDTKCFFIIRTDETVEDFSYRKCIIGALERIDPKKANIQKKKWLENGKIIG
ncbi:hypothetical protein RIF29_34276 [Crotalaria pallida]|uniref:DNA-directed RNA polymerase n=1 Tax=Crotalaria pallida TaxID=3830 RepID=A0AAN9E989_CROPI